jgi:hypothetical protein
MAHKPIQGDKKRYSHITWGERSSFDYSGSVETGTEIYFDKGGWKAKVSAGVYRALRHHFMGRTVNIGTSRTDPPKGSMGEWLNANVTQAALACYVGLILIIEGYAKRIGKHEICIIK